MKPTATIRLRKYYRCERLCRPYAGRYIDIRSIQEAKMKTFWMCHECIQYLKDQEAPDAVP